MNNSYALTARTALNKGLAVAGAEVVTVLEAAPPLNAVGVDEGSTVASQVFDVRATGANGDACMF
jgi:hypothetical protein